MCVHECSRRRLLLCRRTGSCGPAAALEKFVRVLSRSILMVIIGAPVAANGMIRKSTTRIESTREMSLSYCGVEGRAETGEGEKPLSSESPWPIWYWLCRLWKRIVRRVEPNHDKRNSSAGFR